MKRALMAVALAVAFALSALAQQYTGMTGLIHTPDAEMDTTGTARIGAHFLNRHFTPPGTFIFDGKKYDTFDAYLSITPFSWVEIGVTFTMFRKLYNLEGQETHNKKDRYFSVKFLPLREKKGKWWPAVAVGGNDIISSDISFSNDPRTGNKYFRNYYVAATKHFDIGRHEVAATLAYRYFTNRYKGWSGVVGGVTWRPAFARNFRAIAEYAGHDVNIGVDAIFWKHLLVQVSLQNFKYPSGGICYVVNLF